MVKDVRSVRRAPGPPRGVLPNFAPEGRTQHERLLPCESVSPFVAHFWWVGWDLTQPLVAETLPHPAVHALFEMPGARDEVSGVQTRRFIRKLEGKGRVFGIKFRPGAFYPFLGRSVATLRDRVRPVADVLGETGLELQRVLEGVVSLGEGMERAEAVLIPRLPSLSPEVAHIRDFAERLESDRSILRAEDAAEISGLGVRTLERRFREYVGVSPKWVIRRYRLIEAAEQLKQGKTTSLAELAAALGYFDQSHFVRDFKSLVGCTPSAFSAGADDAPRVRR